MIGAIVMKKIFKDAYGWMIGILWVLAPLLLLGLSIWIEVIRWHAFEALIGKKIGLWEFVFLFGRR